MDVINAIAESFHFVESFILVSAFVWSVILTAKYAYNML